jgi:hypothetical protein
MSSCRWGRRLGGGGCWNGGVLRRRQFEGQVSPHEFMQVGGLGCWCVCVWGGGVRSCPALCYPRFTLLSPTCHPHTRSTTDLVTCHAPVCHPA